MKILVQFVILLAVAAALVVTINYRTIPAGDTSQTHFDTIVVLGNPANPDGTPGPEQRERTMESVREYKAGVAPKIIMTGGAAHNQYTEAHVMAQLAVSQGVPSTDVIEEPQAQNTLQNIFYSAQIMHDHGWKTAEIVSSPSHLPRTGLIMQAFDKTRSPLAFDWHTHASQWPPQYGLKQEWTLYYKEAMSCFRLRIHGFPPSRFLPA